MEPDNLPYVSSAPDFISYDETTSKDAAELSTLEYAFKLLKERKAYYNSVDSVSLDYKTEGPVRQQIKDNKRMLYLINELETLLASGIDKARRTING